MLNGFKNRQLTDFIFRRLYIAAVQIDNVPVSGWAVIIKVRHASVIATVEWRTSVQYARVPIMFFDIFCSSLAFYIN